MLTLDDQELAVTQYLQSLERRIQVLENTFVQLLIALKEGGVIVDSEEDSVDSYSFDPEGQNA